MSKKDVEILSRLGPVLALLLMGPTWVFGVRFLIPVQDRINILNLINEHWAYRGNFIPYLDWKWPQLLAVGYQYYFFLAVIPTVLVWGGVASFMHGSLKSLVHAVAAGAVGAVIGFAAIQMGDLPAWAATLGMAVLALVFGGLGPVLMGPRQDGSGPAVVRGTTIVQRRVNSLQALKKAEKQGHTAIAGVVLDREDEVRHFAAVGITGSGKSTALRDLMHSALARGDRHVVADPDGGAMALFYRRGDTVLNPFDARSGKWDILAEIQDDSDYQFLADSVLPHTGVSSRDEWVSYAQQIFAGCLRGWHENQLGSSDEFFTAVATARTDTLAELCKGTAAHRYFEPGNERMLGSIMGALAPVLDNLRQLARIEGPPFSVRRWVREGTGSLWMPYRANQIAALRGLVSCWMRLSIFEALSLPVSDSRRIWFHIDELDALGRIAGLKDAQSRLRKFGGCVVLGFQSIAQVRAVYGDADAKTIVENCGNKLVLRCETSEGGGTARFASDLIGEREVTRDETTSSQTAGRNDMRSRTTTQHERRQTEKAVLPSEVMQLPDR